MDQMMSQHKNKVMIVAIVVAIVVVYKMDWIKTKWNCVKNCYTSPSVSHMAAVQSTDDGNSSIMNGSVAAASAQMAATNSGLGVMYQPPSANGMYALGDPSGDDGLASYHVSGATANNATLAETLSPLSPKDYTDSLAWLQAQQVQVQPELLPNGVSAEYTSLLSSQNFLSAGNTEGAITRPVFRNGSQQDFFRPQVLVSPDVTVGGGFNMPVSDPVVQVKNLWN